MDSATWPQRIAALSLDPSDDVADPARLRSLVGDARVVGLGESAHGVHEFTTLKRRLVEFLVVHCGFRAIALEASYSACTAIDQWIRRGIGDRASALSGQHYLAWDCEEFATLLDWLRAHNERVAPSEQVAFFGLDSGYNSAARDVVTAFLTAYAPGRLAAIRPVFDVLAAQEPNWPFRIGEDATAAIMATRTPLDALADYLDEDPDGVLTAASADSRAEVARLVRVMRQSADWPDFTRSVRMGENLLDLVENGGIDGGFVVWAHNTHLGVALPDGQQHLGDVVRAQLGDAYRPIAFEFGTGSYLTRTLDDDLFAGTLVATTMTSARPDSTPDLLAGLGPEAWMTDTRGLGDGERDLHGGMWIASDEPDTLYEPADISRSFDGLVYVDSITPTQPTENARRAADRREGF